MCRLFGLNAGQTEVQAKYWLVTAADSMAKQSLRNTSGAGIGWFDNSPMPHVVKHPGPAKADTELTHTAEDVNANTIMTHVRAATAGSESLANTHPFLVDGLLIAHNGGFGELAKVDAHLGAEAGKIRGQTDSERYAHLIAKETRARDGDVAGGIVAAAEWLSRNVPMYSLNVVVIANGRMWALRYPDERSLHFARRVLKTSSDDSPDFTWGGSSAVARHQIVASGETPVVVVASERIDRSEDWLMMQSGELISIDESLTITSSLALRRAPAHLVKLEEHDPNREGF